MKIKNIELNNFKAHNSLLFDIDGNCLLYGENGVGKSSIFEALYSNLYHNKRLNKNIDIREKFKNRNHKDKNLEVKILFDNEKYISRLDNDVENLELLSNSNIFLANERILTNLIENDFYKVLNKILIEHFPILKELLIYERLERQIKREELKEDSIKIELEKLNKKFNELFHKYISKDKINDILLNSFNEKFKIDFDIKDSYKDELDFYYPVITIKIDDLEHENDLYNYFNEAKLKLISIAIYLSLIQQNQITGSNLNLLILDDFLTSLDMANRKLIVQYILDNFSEYQKIIFTHNIHFLNLAQSLIKSRDEIKQWQIKNMFCRVVNNNFESIVYDKDLDYIKVAEKYIEEDKLQEAGNTIRKEFERIVEELRIINEVGAKEKLSNILDELLKNNKTKDVNKNKLQKVLKKAKFYQQIVMHSASHEDTETELYKKDCEGAMVVLNELNKCINTLKNKK